MNSILLASKSPRRRDLLALIVPEFSLFDPSIDERGVSAATPAALCVALAAAKCNAAHLMHPDKTVIGCDTIVALDGIVYGKPLDTADAKSMLRRLSGRSHHVYTGVCIQSGSRTRKFSCRTTVTFDDMNDAEIEAYIATGEPFDKAGAYGVQGGAAKFVKSIRGDYFNVMGLPLSRLYKSLKSLGEIAL